MKRNKVILTALALTLLYVVWTYNRLVVREQAIVGQWAQVEAVAQRRADLIPNLVATVQGAAAHERETLMAVTEARTRAGRATMTAEQLGDAEAMAEFQAAQQAVSSSLTRLLAVAENYPQLRANENFLSLQSQVEGSENRIAVQRMRFNEAVGAYNALRSSFPALIVANLLGFESKAMFRADEGAHTAPTVRF